MNIFNSVVVWLWHCRVEASDGPTGPATEDRNVDTKQWWNDELTGNKPNIGRKGRNPIHNPNLAIKNPGLPGDWTRGSAFYMSITQVSYLCRIATSIPLHDRVTGLARPWHNLNNCRLLIIMTFSSFIKFHVRIQAGTPRILTEAPPPPPTPKYISYAARKF